MKKTMNENIQENKSDQLEKKSSKTSTKKSQIDRGKIDIPQIILTEMAALQIKLLLENQYQSPTQYFRIKIQGKGCDGFTYAAGLTPQDPDDFEVTPSQKDLTILMDPFTAFYSKELSLDYFQDFESDLEGFLVTNLNQKEYQGKFWTKDPSKIPPLRS